MGNSLLKIYNATHLDPLQSEILAAQLNDLLRQPREQLEFQFLTDIEGYYLVELYIPYNEVILLGTFDFQEFEVIA